MIEDYKATTRNGHKLKDFYNLETNTLDIRSNGLYPSNVLSNMCGNEFIFDGVECGSMEGFLQSIKHKDIDRQHQICSMKGGNAKKHSVKSWQIDQIVYWKGQAISRHSEEYQELLRRVYRAMFDQNDIFRSALLSTHGISLIHSCGEEDPFKTILTKYEFCQILTELRNSINE